MSKSFNLRLAEKTLRAGDPLSLDLVMALAEEGIDASVVEQRINEEAERGKGFYISNIQRAIHYEDGGDDPILRS